MSEPYNFNLTDMDKRFMDWAELPEGREAVKHAAEEIAKAIDEDIAINAGGSQFRFVGGSGEEIKSNNIDIAVHRHK